MKKCFIVTGTEKSGSRLVARIISHVLGVKKYDKWEGIGIVKNKEFLINHKSIPYGNNNYPNLEYWDKEYKEYDVYYIICIRDINISELSRKTKFSRRDKKKYPIESKEAKDIFTKLIKSKRKTFIFSYESFMFLEESYLRILYDFIDIDSNFLPKLIDGNKKYLKK